MARHPPLRLTRQILDVNKKLCAFCARLSLLPVCTYIRISVYICECDYGFDYSFEASPLLSLSYCDKSEVVPLNGDFGSLNIPNCVVCRAVFCASAIAEPRLSAVGRSIRKCNKEK